MKSIKLKKKIRRHRKIRAKIIGTALRPRLSIFRSNKHLALQLIDDAKGRTILQASDIKIKKKMTKIEKAREVGENLAKAALAKKIKKVVFDRGGYIYHGRITAAADGARQGGLEF